MKSIALSSFWMLYTSSKAWNRLSKQLVLPSFFIPSRPRHVRTRLWLDDVTVRCKHLRHAVVRCHRDRQTSASASAASCTRTRSTLPRYYDYSNYLRDFAITTFPSSLSCNKYSKHTCLLVYLVSVYLFKPKCQASKKLRSACSPWCVFSASQGVKSN